MRKLLAVSGGIDSVVMLHLFRGEKNAAVVHFDHGIRESSAEDCAFVEKLAEEYGLPFYSKRAELGEDCSEEKARASRYAFFESLLESPEDKIYTAHHRDDLLESVVINLLRGTGWRGLSPLRNAKIERPLLDWTKADIYRYATEHRLRFRLDQTNSNEKYLRNRVRDKLRELSETKKQELVQLSLKQRELADEIDEILKNIAPNGPQFEREFFCELSRAEAMEFLRFCLASYVSLTRPQLERALRAIREYLPGKRFSLSKDYFLLVHKYYFEIEKSGAKNLPTH